MNIVYGKVMIRKNMNSKKVRGIRQNLSAMPLYLFCCLSHDIIIAEVIKDKL